MAEIKSRIISKHDIEANWLQAVNFVPKKGEHIVYDIEIDEQGNTLPLPAGRTVPYDYERLKIGDGKTKVNDLPFIHNQPDWNQTDSAKSDYIKNKPDLNFLSKNNPNVEGILYVDNINSGNATKVTVQTDLQVQGYITGSADLTNLIVGFSTGNHEYDPDNSTKINDIGVHTPSVYAKNINTDNISSNNNTGISISSDVFYNNVVT